MAAAATVGDAVYPSLRDRAVLVTGGATGIGAGVVEHFARQGARVAFLDIAIDAGRMLVARLAEEGLPAPHFEPVDLTAIGELRDAVARAAAAVGPFTVLVNNAAHDERHRWQDVTPEYWDNRLAVNLRHHFFVIQAVAPGMIAAGGGSIVNMGSISWRIGRGGMPGYVASKAAIEALTRSFARDLGPHGIRVNCVLPGWIMTERQETLWLTPEADAERARLQCLPGKLYPADIARMILFLAADDSRMCTDQNFVVDGGWT